MNTVQLARQAVRLYPHQPYTERRAVNTLRRGWMRQITYLGDRWLLAASVQRKQAGSADAIVLAVTVACTLIAVALPWPL